MVDYLQTLTDSQQNHSLILEKINILVFGYSSHVPDVIRICRVLYY